ncbi:CrcB family protein [Nesterenkonia sp. NBAIMH1]|uniref:FluC/FEX family fluoride channel n=1 Tax=Nesterenkonia sp. NBAIMH1 TaxID=2600320 RepID=UPI00143CCEA0|nr:CrcB family protein [Nesterenkonia sp. NBAIMH1]
MRTAALVLAVAAAGAAGTLLRLAAGQLVGEAEMRFPWTTFAVNIAGSAGLGLLVGMIRVRRPGDWVMPVLGTGLLGSFTTLSAVMVVAGPSLLGGSFAEGGPSLIPDPLEMMAYLIIAVLFGTAAAGCGITVGQAIFDSVPEPTDENEVIDPGEGMPELDDDARREASE